MKIFNKVLFIIAVIFLLSGCASTKAVDVAETIDQEYTALAGKTPKLDGAFDDAVWKGARWDHDYVLAGSKPDSGAEPPHFNFAVCSDDQFIYIAVEITDEVLVYGEHTGNDSWMDDSLEICLDPMSEKSTSYDPNDSALRISASAIGKREAEWGDVNKGLLADFSGSGAWTGLKAKAVAVETEKGWNIEAAIPLENEGFSLAMKDGLSIGFNLVYNNNDSEAGRDSMLGWSKKKDWTLSGKNASVFGNVKFSGDVVASRKQSEKTVTDAKKQEPGVMKTVQARVIEYRSRSKVVVMQIGSSTNGIKVGLEGKIYNDATRTKENGTVQLTKVTSTYSEGIVRSQIVDLDINANEVIAVFEIPE